MNKNKSIDIPADEKTQVPLTPEGRVKELVELSLKQKKAFVPPVGSNIRMGPFIFEVAVINVSQLRFTAKLADVIIDGVNDGESGIIDSKTGRVFK